VGNAPLKFAALGWTLAALFAAWAIVERRARQAAEHARATRERESDAERVDRMRRLRAATDAMRAALESTDDDHR
jgi:hypothetical protein